MANPLTQKERNAKIEEHTVAFVNATTIMAPLPRKLDMFFGIPVVRLAPTREQARVLYKTLKEILDFKQVPGYAGLLENKNNNIQVQFSECDSTGRITKDATVHAFNVPTNEYFIVTVAASRPDHVDHPDDPALIVLRKLTDLGGVVKPYENNKVIGAVVEFPQSLAGTNSVYGGVSDEHQAARIAVLKQIETQPDVTPGTYKSEYRDSFNLGCFYAAAPKTPKWLVVRAK